MIIHRGNEINLKIIFLKYMVLNAVLLLFMYLCRCLEKF